MTTVNVQSASGEVTGTLELPDALFDAKVNVPLVHQVVVAQLAAARQGTHDTKTRGEVRGGGRKPYRQKGTGRARQGSTRAPQFVGGGTVHGPTPRSYAQRTPKKMKAAALRSALSDRARGGRVHVVSALVEGETPSTKSAATALAAVSERRHVLVVADREDTLTWKSVRNLETVHLLAPDQLNTYDVLVSDDVIFTQGALATFVGRDASLGDVSDLLAVTPVAKPAKKAASKTAARKAPAKKAAATETEPEAASEGGTDATDAADEQPSDDATPPVKKAATKKTTAKKAAAAKSDDADTTDDAPPSADEDA
jgi:large subunit ribosomal protein L4